MLKIRLTRVGKKNSPAYRVVVAEQKKAVKRKFIEIIGHYNPISQPKEIVIKKDRALFWIGQGAQPSDTVNNLMCELGILDKSKKIVKVFAKKAEVAKEEVVEEKAAEKVAEETPAVEAEAPVAEEAVETVETAPTTESVGVPTESVGKEVVEEAKAPETAEEVVEAAAEAETVEEK
ncbi:MAG: 30S ribosomal protein S16 [Candidatus Berkelbacteria bacterium]